MEQADLDAAIGQQTQVMDDRTCPPQAVGDEHGLEVSRHDVEAGCGREDAPLDNALEVLSIGNELGGGGCPKQVHLWCYRQPVRRGMVRISHAVWLQA